MTCNQVNWQWKAINLDNTDGLLGKSDPFLKFFKLRKSGDQLQVYQTHVVMNELNPIWHPFKISDYRLCNDYDTPFRVECWDWDAHGKFTFIGDCEITLNALMTGETEFELKAFKTRVKAGTLKLMSFRLEERKSFNEYIREGEHLKAIVAIDFTTSNKSGPNGCLHQLKDNTLNDYQKAINSVCDIILHYVTEPNVPVFGFGGKPKYHDSHNNETSHYFPCINNPEQPSQSGLSAISDAYRYALEKVTMSGPTKLAPLISEVEKACREDHKALNKTYTILLIFTPGEVQDMTETVDKIIEASDLPLSIVIVGLGKANVKKLDYLDGDFGLKGSNNKTAPRDIVQFVPFQEFNGDMDFLSQRILDEVPYQLCEYMQSI